MTRWLLSALLVLPLAAQAFDFDAELQTLLDREQALIENRDGLSEPERFDALIDLSFDITMLEFPEFGTFIGHPAGQDRWSDNSLAAVERRNERARRLPQMLAMIDRAALDEADRLNYDLLMYAARMQADGTRFPEHLMPITQLSGVQQDVARIFRIMPSGTEAQLENILARLAALSPVLANDIAHLRAGLAAGITPPQITLRDVPGQIAALITDDPMQSALMSAFANMPDTLDERTRQRLARRAAGVYRKDVAPALREMHAFFTDEYLPGARRSVAATELPDGEAWYAHRVREMTTTEMTPRQIHELGLAEVKRIRAAMDEVISATGFEGDFAAFTEFLRTDPQFYFQTPAELITAYRDISKRADAATIRVIGKLPRLPYGVEPIPDFIAKSQTTAYYQQGSAEAARPGVFFANTYDLRTRPKWEMEALSLHEAVPGHHLQLALQAEIDMPWFRRFGGQTAFVEGWGLYSESLGEEMGFYTDPYSKFGQLTYEMWRAIRLVVDTGMHAFGWTREEAIGFFAQNASKTEHDIVVEIDRYIVWPGQALAYKIGELKIKELRARAERALGEAFDLRAFHDSVLANGGVPLDVLEAHVDEWLARQQARTAAAD